MELVRGIRRRMRAVRNAADVLRDYWSFRRRHGAVLRSSGSGGQPRTILVVSLSDFIAQLKIEGLLAKALQARGFAPVIATLRQCRWARPYFSVYGFDNFVYLDDFMTVAGPGDGTRDDRVVDDTATVRSLLGLEYHGVDVGRHALSSVTRRFRHGSLELHHPEVRAHVEEALRRSRALVPAVEALVASVKPDMALFLERGYTPYGEIFDVLVNEGVNTIQWFHGHRSDALAFKRYTRETRDLHGFSVSPSTWERVRAMPWSGDHDREILRDLQDRYETGTWFARKFANEGKWLKAPEEVRRQLGLDPAKKTAVIFSHILWDATFFFGENLFDDYEQWLVETVRVACQNPAVNWVVKLHPDYVWKLKLDGAPGEVRDEIAIRAKIGALPAHVRVVPPDTDINTFSLFPVTDYCLTVRGTIGVEMPCFGIPVFTAGTGRYSGLGFTNDSKSREEYLDKLRRIQEFPRLSEEEARLARKHAYVLLKLRLCPFTSFELAQVPLARLGHPLDLNAVIRIQTAKDLHAAADLEAFARWAIESREPDFLLPDVRGSSRDGH